MGPLVRLTVLALAPTLIAASASPESHDRKGGAHTMSFFSALIASFRNEDEGQGLAEYALILALIAIVAILALLFLGGQISRILSVIGSSV